MNDKEIQQEARIFVATNDHHMEIVASIIGAFKKHRIREAEFGLELRPDIIPNAAGMGADPNKPRARELEPHMFGRLTVRETWQGSLSGYEDLVKKLTSRQFLIGPIRPGAMFDVMYSLTSDNGSEIVKEMTYLHDPSLTAKDVNQKCGEEIELFLMEGTFLSPNQ